MQITMRFPRQQALEMGLVVDEGVEEIEVTLPAVELAGRLTLATGKLIRPEGLREYARRQSENAGTPTVETSERGEKNDES